MNPFECADIALLRAPALPEELADEVRDGVDLPSLVALPEVRAAIRLSSPALADSVEEVLAGRTLKPADLRRVMYSVSRYRIRMSTRATPFGLMAGVAPIVVGGTAKVRLGLAHRPVSRVSLPWLAKLLEEWEPRVLDRLRVVVNGLCVRRGDRVELTTGTSTVSVRHSADVESVLAQAREPVPFRDLVADPATVRSLIRHRVLLTDLLPPPDAVDPLQHVIDKLGSAPEMVEEHVDLALDAEVRLPGVVAEEVADTALTLWRLASEEPGPPEMRAYHADFLERYGCDRPVPLTELLCSTKGLGPPAGYLMPPGHRTEPAPVADVDRDVLLAELAQQDEVVLDDRLLERLVRNTTEPGESLELRGELLSDSLDALASGDFRFVLTGGSPVAGAMLGRFAHLFNDEEVARLTALVRPDAVQILSAHGGNVAAAPRLASHAVVVDGFADDVLPLDDLVVSVDPTRFRVHSISLGREVVPTAFHVLDPARSPNAERFLRDVAAYGVHRWRKWDWGAMTALPRLPRVSRGRTVLARAQWRPSFDVRDMSLPFERWCAVLDEWRTRWRVPDVVHVGDDSDRFLELDLTDQLHRHTLHQQLERIPGLVLREVLRGSGWLAFPDGTRRNEIVFPLVCKEKRKRAPMPLLLGRSAHLPGGSWVYAKLYCAADRRTDLLLRDVPRLVRELPAAVDRWFFVRYRDPEPHLRLRLHGGGRDELCRWADGLHRDGLIGSLVLDTYDPEVERYGGAIQSAERVFHADSVLVLNLLRLVRAGRLTADPAMLAATSFLDIGRSFSSSWRNLVPKGDGSRGGVPVEIPSMLKRGWERRSAAVAAFAELVGPQGEALRSLLHMHHNRLVGADSLSEARSYALMRDMARRRG